MINHQTCAILVDQPFADTLSRWYQHYKGSICYVLAIASDEKTLETMVIYSHFYYKDGIQQNWSNFVRPEKDFLGIVEHNGEKMRRFKPIEPPKWAL